MKPIGRLKIYMLSTGMSMSEFAISIGMAYESLRSAFKRESDLNTETLANIKKGHPDLSLDWLVLGLETEGEKLSQKKQLIQEPDILVVYDLLDSLKIHEGETEKLKDIKREIVRLYSIHNQLKDDMIRLRNLTNRTD